MIVRYTDREGVSRIKGGCDLKASQAYPGKCFVSICNLFSLKGLLAFRFHWTMVISQGSWGFLSIPSKSVFLHIPISSQRVNFHHPTGLACHLPKYAAAFWSGTGLKLGHSCGQLRKDPKPWTIMIGSTSSGWTKLIWNRFLLSCQSKSRLWWCGTKTSCVMSKFAHFKCGIPTWLGGTAQCILD